MREKMKYMDKDRQIWKERDKIMAKDMMVNKGKDRISIRMRAKGMQYKRSQKGQWCRYKYKRM